MAITKAEVAEYEKLEKDASDLERQAKTFRDRQKQLVDKFEADLKESNKPSVVRHGYTLAWVNGTASVPWADEYLKVAGVAKVNALKEAAAAKAVGSKMKILPPAAAPEEKKAAS